MSFYGSSNHKGCEMKLQIVGIDHPDMNVDVFAGDLDVLAWSWGLGVHHHGQVQGSQPPQKPERQMLSITKWQGLESAYFYKMVDESIAIGTVRFTCSSESLDTVFELKQAKIESIYTGGSGGEQRLTENIALRFESVNIEYVDKTGESKKTSKTTL